MKTSRKFIRKPPPPSEAVQFNGENIQEVKDFCADAFVREEINIHNEKSVFVKTDTTGIRCAKQGDWIVNDSKSGFLII